MRVKLGLVALVGALGCSQGVDPPAETTAVYIPGGNFLMGSTVLDPCGEAKLRGSQVVVSCDAQEFSENIRNNVVLDDYCIDQHEVTIDQYRHCVARGECDKPLSTNAGNSTQKGFIQKYYSNFETYGKYPVVGVTWAQAQTYCAFHGGALPTEAQWEYAGRSAGVNEYIIDPDVIADIVTEDCEENTSRVTFGACTDQEIQAVTSRAGNYEDKTAEGVRDLAGSVAEWVGDEFDFLAYCDVDQSGDSIYELYKMEDEPLTPSIVSSGRVPNRFVEDAACLDNRGSDPAGCRDIVETCLGTCRDAFGNDNDSSAKRNSWRRAYCNDSVSGDGQLLDTANKDRACGVEQCTEGATNCTDLCDCLTDPAFGDPTPDDDTDCLNQCFDNYVGCAKNCMNVDNVQVACIRQTERNEDKGRPLPICEARSLDGEASAVPHKVPGAFVKGTRIADAHVVRGADFQEKEACLLRHSRRRFQVTTSPKVGFRCAYRAGSERCARR